MIEPPTERIPVVPPSAGRPRRRGVAGRIVGAIAFALVVSVFLVPDLWFGLDRWSPFTQLIAFRPVLVVAVAVMVVVLALVTVGMRRAWPFPVAMLVVLALGVSMLAPRMVADPAPTGGETLKVLSFNVYTGDADVDALAETIRTERPDVVALPEAGERYRQRLQPLVEDLGYVSKASVGQRSQDVNGVIALVSPRFGDVDFRVGQISADSPFPYVEVSGGRMGELTFVAFHSVAPTAGSVAQWRVDLAGAGDWCRTGRPTVVAGDFNATLDHSVLREAMADCGDAASQRGSALTATWPTSTPRWLGTEIDHVFSSTGTAESFEVLDLPGSDHRAILTTIRL
ncbi:endonuclease/exonuclease/phosphatase family protein [Pseudonocardia xishanensis]|uniref:Endonuclease/exonuclease/phosphatase domain-containing protein n=1 Tax=Pseudonocardia xishanensis TaxID=630995 RepID=A0ABP8RQ95_9PSEU